MLSMLILVIVAVLIVIVVFIALDYLASAMGGDRRLWLVLKAAIILIALVMVLQRSGVV